MLGFIPYMQESGKIRGRLNLLRKILLHQFKIVILKKEDEILWKIDE